MGATTRMTSLSDLEIKILGLFIFLGIIAYWYFLPVQFFWGLIGAGSMWGSIIANTIALWISIMIGIPLSLVLGIIACAMVFTE